MRPPGPGGVEAMHPVAQRLAVHAADLIIYYISNGAFVDHATAYGCSPNSGIPASRVIETHAKRVRFSYCSECSKY
jgi:hypothetical protein